MTDDLKALDRAVATDVMGWVEHRRRDYNRAMSYTRGVTPDPLPEWAYEHPTWCEPSELGGQLEGYRAQLKWSPSTNIRYAWRVIPRMRELGCSLTLHVKVDGSASAEFVGRLVTTSAEAEATATNPAAEAICRAALAMVRWLTAEGLI